MSESKRDVQSGLKALRLNGMVSAWADLMEQDGGSSIQSSRWLIEHLLQAEDVDRHMRSIAHQMKAARFPIHRDLAGFDFEVSPVDKVLIKRLADLSFTDDAQNVVLIGGPGTGKTHLATALGINGLTHHCIRPANPSTPNEQLQAPSCPRKPSCTPCLKRFPIRAPVSPARAGSTARNSRLN